MKYQVSFYQDGCRQVLTDPIDYLSAQQIAADCAADYQNTGAEFDTDNFDYAVEPVLNDDDNNDV